MTTPAAPAPAAPADASSGSPLGWAAYLGCSWTWCIGMFMPILLLRDYGLWGFLVFALPNAIGAAAMGWTLKDAAASRRFVERHPEAIYLFSAITIAFHAFWLTWLATFIRGLTGTGLLDIVPALAAALGLAAWLARDRHATHRLAAIVLWLCSAGFLVALLLLAESDPVSPPSNTFFTTTDAMGHDLLALAPVCVFGFALCPYLDATFHRARQQTSPAGGRVAFTVGFLGLFASMIVLTTVYAGPFIASLDREPATVPAFVRWAAIGLMMHLACQLVLTVRLHQHASRPLEPQIGESLTGFGRALPLAGALLAIMTMFVPQLAGLFSGEFLYRCFISAYGLVLPAYVWICGIPTRDGHAGLAGPRGRFKLSVLAIAVIVATPMYYVGYIMLEEWWLWPGLAVLLLARLPVMLMSPRPPATA